MRQKMESEEEESGEHWLSIGDMMSGLMVIFLFIAITYMIEVMKEKNKIIEIAVTYEKNKDLIYQRLYSEFKDDLKAWDATLERGTLTVRFQEPDILFDLGKADIKQNFKDILDKFFPRYISILRDFKDEIEEIRIEGHTSSGWGNNNQLSKNESYFKNMTLSQERTRATLEYCLMLPQIEIEREWIKSVLTANGLSSSKLIHTIDGSEDAERSRRVEFRIRTNAEQQVVKILQGK
jgi:outer membrane protein OmpA-like peptidoglycan-associated protein